MEVPNPKAKRRAGAGSAAATCEQRAEACLQRIADRDRELKAFVCVREADEILAEARQRDSHPAPGPLNGVPFGVKDVFDTDELPTAYGSPYYDAFFPSRDAAAVSMLRSAGAILIGKLATVEFAGIGAIPPTRNPRDPSRSPGGSSAGSGAAVGAGLVPLALATQTGGSTIRPAAFCGVAGMKPTWGRISTEGMKPFAPSLDTVGWIAEDAALLARAAEALGISFGTDATDPGPLRLGIYWTPYRSEAQPEAVEALLQAAERLRQAGHRVEEVRGPDDSQRLNEWQDVLMFGEGIAALQAEFRRDEMLAHPGVRDLVENRKGITHSMMVAAYDSVAALRPRFDAALAGYDAWLTPPVPGVAPPFEDGNGLATFNRLFTALHLPCITLPGFSGPCGLPVGIQLIGPRFSDARLLNTARRVESSIRDA